MTNLSPQLPDDYHRPPAPETLDMKIVHVSPDLARQWFNLIQKDKQRRFDRGYAMTFVDDFTEGRHVLLPDPIIFDAENRLRNGQHRLWAVMNGDQTLPFYVLWNATEELILAFDRGRTRTLTQQLTLQGEMRGKILGPLIRRMWLWDHGYLVTGSVSRKVSVPTLVTYLDQHPELRQWAERVQDNGPPGISPSVAATAGILFARCDPAAAERFWDAWVSGAELAPDSPILLLREKLIRVSDKTSDPYAKNRVSDDRLAYACTAWNHWRAGNTIGKLQLPKGGLRSENFPKPK